MREDRHLPTIIGAFAACVAVTLLTPLVLRLTGHGGRDIVEIFPLSRFNGPRLVPAGLPYVAPFAVLLWFALRVRLSAIRAWSFGLGLIVAGNLMQGGFRAGFLLPVRVAPPGRLYLTAAAAITSSSEWLGSFTALQSGLHRAPGTHPPFTVLLYRVLGHPVAIAVIFTLIASLSIPIVNRILLAVGMDRRRAALGALLFSVVPAVNIYSGVSLDGVILTTSALCLLGIVRLFYGERWSWSSAAMVLSGLLLTNALTFGGLLLAGVLLVRLSETETRCWHFFWWPARLPARWPSCASGSGTITSPLS